MKMKDKRGITLVALVITIIVMLILVGVTIATATNGGLFSSARKATFLTDVGKYKEELEAYKGGHYEEVNESKINSNWNNENEDIKITKYIPSFAEKYKDKLEIRESELVYVGSNTKEQGWAQEIGIKVIYETAKIKVEIQGEGTVEGASSEGIVYRTDTKQTLTAIPGSKDINGTQVSYTFDGWYLNGELVSTDSTYEITILEDATYTAKFVLNEISLIYYLDSNNEEQIELNSNTTLSGYQNRSDITKAEIGNGVTIQAMSFAGCTGLESIKIGDNVTIVSSSNYVNNSGTFGNCTSLKKVIMGENITITIGYYYNYLFYGCTGLENVTIGSLSAIPTYALTGTKGALKGTIKINEGVITIGDNAFSGCTGITEVVLPSTLTTIGARAFNGCLGIENMEIPNSVKTIGESAFYNCTKIVGKVIISENASIEKNAFSNCSSLESIEIKNGASIKLFGFAGCTNLQSLKIGDNVTIVSGAGSVNNSGTFGNCTNLKTVEMGENTSITGNSCYYNYLFYGCNSLEDVTVKSLSSIAPYAFTGAKGALNGIIKINEGVTTIGDLAFKGCTGITSVILPSTLTTIGANAFNGCTGITEFDINMTEAQFTSNVSKGSNWNTNVNAQMLYK